MIFARQSAASLTAGLGRQQLAVSAAGLGRISRGLRWIRSGLRVSSSMFRPQTRLRSLPNKATRELTGWLIGHPVFTLRAGGSWSLQPSSAPGHRSATPALAEPRRISAAREAKPGHRAQLRGTRFGFTTGSMKLQGVQVQFPQQQIVGPSD